MKNLNVYQNGLEYANDEKRAYPAVSLVYDQAKPQVNPAYRKGVFIELIDGTLVRANEFDKATMVANNIYVSDGVRCIRLSLTWCNEDNCQALCATSNGTNARPSGVTTGVWYKDDGKGDKYGYKFARTYRWRSGYNAPVRWDVVVDGISRFDSWDFDGKKETEFIKQNFDIKEFPAFHAAATYVAPNGETGYLMGISELQFCYGFKDEIADCAAACGADAFDYGTDSAEDEEGNEYYYIEHDGVELKCPDEYLWSASQRGDYESWNLNTDDNGYLENNNKNNNYPVRAAF